MVVWILYERSAIIMVVGWLYIVKHPYNQPYNKLYCCSEKELCALLAMLKDSAGQQRSTKLREPNQIEDLTRVIQQFQANG